MNGSVIPDRLSSGQNSKLLILILGALTCLGPMAIDLYLPGIPAIARDMGEPAGRIQLTLSAYTIGFALGQIIFGPLSDRYGRVRVMLPGLMVYIVSGVLAALTETANQLIAVRILQALAGAAIMVCIPAMVRDLFPRESCARVMSSILLVMTVAPLVAPLLGGQLLKYWGWQSLFLFLALLGAMALVLAIFHVRESLPNNLRSPLTFTRLLDNYRSVLTHRQAMGCILAHGFFFGGMFAFISASPFVYIELFGVEPENYGFLFGANILAMGCCNALNMRLVGRYKERRMLSFGSRLAALAAIVLVINVLTGFGGLAGIVVPVIVYIACLGFTGPNSNAMALSFFPRFAGTANAVAGVLRFGIGGVTAGLAGVFHNGTAEPMAVIMVVCGLLSAASLWLVKEDTDADRQVDVPEQDAELDQVA